MSVTAQLSSATQAIHLRNVFKTAKERLEQQARVYTKFDEDSKSAEQDFRSDDQWYDMAYEKAQRDGKNIWPGAPVTITGVLGTRTYKRPTRKHVPMDVETLSHAEGFIIRAIVDGFGDKAPAMLEELYADVPKLMTSKSEARISSLKNAINGSFYVGAVITPLSSMIDLEIAAASVAVKMENRSLVDTQYRRLEKMERRALNPPGPIMAKIHAFAEKLGL